MHAGNVHRRDLRRDRAELPGRNDLDQIRELVAAAMENRAIDVNRPRQRQEDEVNSRRILLIDRIQWRDGWPFIGTPSEGPQAAPVT